jgi:TPR repeat protein
MKSISMQHRDWRTALTAAFLLAFAGNAVSQNIMRFPRLQPIQVKRDADTNNAYALFIYGSLLIHGDAKREATPTEALPYIERAAELGLARAQLATAELYFLGEAVPQNDAKAIQWYRQAALQGMVEAQFGLAALYERGVGTPVNLTEAARWYAAAAAQDHPASQTKLGQFYLAGTGLKPDKTTGYMWLTLAAAKGSRSGREARDEARDALDTDTIARALQLAANYRVQPHYNANLLKREETELAARAKKLADNPLTEEESF